MVRSLANRIFQPRSGLEPVCSSTRTPDGAISGHNVEQLTGVTPSDCEKACCDKSWCKSFDYHKNSNKCDLSDQTASDVGGPKTDYGGNPYDHYEIVHSPPSGIVLPKVKHYVYSNSKLERTFF